MCACTLHGSIIDFRFRVKNARLDDYTAADEQSNTFIENGILVEKKIIDINRDEEYLSAKRMRR